MDVKRITRRQLLSSVGLTAGATLVPGCSGPVHGSEGTAGIQWQYVRLDPAVVAAEAYRQVPDGGCMYGLFAGIMTVMAREHGEPRLSFPLHMMKYGEGGVGLWGSLCGTVNGGAAIIGLFEQSKQWRESLISELFSWYETTELPTYQPNTTDDSPDIPKTAAGSVLCHVSVGNWCKTSGDEIGSPEMKERCRRLTADVAAKTVELLNVNLHEPCKFAGLSPEIKSCLSCHNEELHNTMGKMRCNSCHQQLSKETSRSAKRANQIGQQSKRVEAMNGAGRTVLLSSHLGKSRLFLPILPPAGWWQHPRGKIGSDGSSCYMRADEYLV